MSAGKATKAAAKARTNSGVTSSGAYRRLISFGKLYQIDEDEDFRAAALMYAAEAQLIDRMREAIDREGLTVTRETRGGDCLCAHPVLQELPKHVQCANSCLSAIADIISKRGARKEARSGLAAFRVSV